MRVRGHPSARLISRYVDELCGPRTREYMHRHLRECHKCRREVAFIRELGRVAREIPSPAPPRTTLDRIVKRWEAGDRMILPVETLIPVDRYSNLKRAGMATTGLAAILVAFALLWPTTEAEAGASYLALEVDRPTAGARVAVEYRPTTALADEDSLRLRARFRTATDGAEEGSVLQTEAAVLHPGSDGIFRGRVRLPRYAVYGRFVVEDPTGGTIDPSRSSEIIVEDDTGRPLFEALYQRILELEGRNWEEAHRTARQMTEEYPERAESWYRLFFFDSRVSSSLAEDATLPGGLETHRERFHWLDRLFMSRPSLRASEMAAMFSFAFELGELDAAERWGRRLIREHPADPFAVQLRMYSLLESLGERPDEYLKALDALWIEVGPVSPGLGEAGFMVASALGDLDAIRTWAERWGNAAPWHNDRIARSLVGRPATRDDGIALLWQLTETYRPSHARYRSLGRTVEEQRWVNRMDLASIWLSLAEAYRRDGRSTEAREALARAVDSATDTGWQPAVLGELAEAALAIGDTTAAPELWARLLADPRTDPEVGEGLPTRLGGAWDSTEMDERIAHHWETLRSSVLDRSQAGTYVPDAALLDLDGEAVSLDELLDGRVTVVAFWSALSPGSVRTLERLDELQAWFRDRGISVVAITEDPVGSETVLPSGLAPAFPMLFDGRQAARSLNVWGTPTVFVLDRFGQVRFTNSNDLEAVRLQAAALVVGAREKLAASD